MNCAQKKRIRESQRSRSGLNLMGNMRGIMQWRMLSMPYSFYGNINTGVERIVAEYYYKDSTRLPAEVFADISSMLAINDCKEPLLKEVVDVFKRNLY